MKNFLRTFLVLTLLAVLFRGPLYRLLVTYEVSSYRTVSIDADPRLQEVSDSLLRESEDLEDFVYHTQRFVGNRLSFRATNSGGSATALLEGGAANCVGYARLTADLLERNIDAFPGQTVAHGVARLSLPGFDLHRLFSNPFYRDHDVVEITDGSGTVLLVDPSLRDYTGIEWVRVR